MSMIDWELVENQYNQAPVADAGPDQVVYENQAVMKADHATTKCRMVLDAS